MNIKISYEKQFERLMSKLKKKYPKEIFDLDGIGKQLDMCGFSKEFFSSEVTADASIDANANVDDVSVIAYENELPKPYLKLNSYYVLWKKIKSLYGIRTANKIVEMQLSGDIYIHDMHGIGAGKAYCFNYSTYDIMTNGLPMIKKIKSLPPKYLYSFKSQLEQFTVIASNSTCGATGLADLLLTMSYYVGNIYKNGHDAGFYFDGWFSDSERSIIESELDSLPDVEDSGVADVEIEKITKGINEKLNKSKPHNDMWFKANVDRYIKENLVSFIYTINQPMRANQSPFTNLSIYDECFLEELKDKYIFPDWSTLDVELVKKLQALYLDIMNVEKKRTPITFPVTTACFSLDRERNIQDLDFNKFIALKNIKFGFINEYNGDTSTISGCCRLRSGMVSEYFNSFGAGATKLGSLGVATPNYVRLAVKAIRDGSGLDGFLKQLPGLVNVVGQINQAKRVLVQERIDNGNLPLYAHGFMELSKQYSTCGVNGLYEALDILGCNILTEDGQQKAVRIISVINKQNDKLEKKYNAPHNTEQVPAENMGIKVSQKDRLLGYNDKYELYSNQFVPLISQSDVLDRMKIQGLLDKDFSGGSIFHCHVENPPKDPKALEELTKLAAKLGIVYWAPNFNEQECSNDHRTVGLNMYCPECSAEIVANYTRVVGFLTKTTNWHKVRREHDYPNRQWYKNIEDIKE